MVNGCPCLCNCTYCYNILLNLGFHIFILFHSFLTFSLPAACVSACVCARFVYIFLDLSNEILFIIVKEKNLTDDCKSVLSIELYFAPTHSSNRLKLR